MIEDRECQDEGSQTPPVLPDTGVGVDHSSASSDKLEDPGFLVFSLPVAGLKHRGIEIGALPVLAVRASTGAVDIPKSTLLWSKNLASSGRSSASISRALKTIGRFAEYVDRVHGVAGLDAETLTLAIYAFVAYRVGDRRPEDPDLQALPAWPPISAEVAWAEYRTLSRYFAHTGSADVKIATMWGTQPTPEFGTSALAYQQQGSRDFFVHLAPHRERWRRMMVRDDDVVSRPAHPIRPPMPKAKSIGNVMSRDEVDAIIRAERNPMIRALWVLLAFGGVRISEALNIWQCDVMPGSQSRYFGDLDATGLPFVLLVDPREGRFVGDIRTPGSSRRDILMKQWGLLPRPDLPSDHPERAGWKSMLLTSGEWKASWIYWIDNRMAEAFAALTSEIRAFHRRYDTAARHPYFFVNMSREANMGGVLKYKNAAKFFDRSCLRAGFEPHRFRRNIHGFRHFYKRVALNEFKLSPATIQIMLHHRSIDSQKAYGQRAADVSAELAKVLSGRIEE